MFQFNTNVEMETSFLQTCIPLADMHNPTSLVQSHGPLCAYLAPTCSALVCIVRGCQ